MEHRQKIVITEPSELKGVVDTVMREVMQRKDGGGATVLALHGELGAGKTTFTQTLARTLGVTDAVTSPTFVIMKLYELQHQSFETLIHIDAYRIEHSDEMRVLGFALSGLKTLLSYYQNILSISDFL